MARNVLIVDDDPTFLRLVSEQCREYGDSFKIHLAGNGIDAVKKLRQLPFSIVFTDLHMPKMDGFSLFDHIRDNFPDIPVAIITGTGKSKTESVMMGKGAYSYIIKPLDRNILVRNVVSAIKKESEAGMLREASLEMFTQLIEMEQKTCTIRVDNKKSGQRGILFFKNGALVNSRIGGYRGRGAAYEIFSWDRVSLSIENVCEEKNHAITDDLQTVLFEAMRRKDESESAKSESEEKQQSQEKQPPKMEASELGLPFAEPDVPAAANVSKKPPKETEIKQDPVTLLRRRLDISLGDRGDQYDLAEDSSLDDFIEHCSRVGDYFGGGSLRSCYISDAVSIPRVAVPGKKTVVINLKSEVIRDSLLNALS